MLFSSKSSFKEMLKRSEMFILRTQLRYRIYQKLEFTQELCIKHPIAAYKLHTVYFAAYLIWRPKGRERVKKSSSTHASAFCMWVPSPKFVQNNNETSPPRSIGLPRHDNRCLPTCLCLSYLWYCYISIQWHGTKSVLEVEYKILNTVEGCGCQPEFIIETCIPQRDHAQQEVEIVDTPYRVALISE